MRRWLGDEGVLVALAFYVLSPMLMYYQRFFRNDALFLFASLWIITSAAEWGRTRRPAWAASGVLGCAVLFSNKESCLFVYFTLATFLLLYVVQDLARGAFARRLAPPVAEPVRAPPAWATGAVIFALVTMFLTRVLEGLKFDADVVAAIGRDFPLRDVRSMAMALGRAPGIEEIGALGSPVFWRGFYALLAVASLGAGVLLQLAVERQWGLAGLVADFWSAARESRWHILGALAGGLFLYLFLYTTAFQYPRGPLELYRDTLGYWMGQHAWHRIEGPFHMHLVNLLLYELPAVLVVLAGAARGLFMMRSSRTEGTALVLGALALAALHFVALSGLGAGASFFGMVAFWAFAAGVAWLAWPASGRWITAVGAIALVAHSAVHFAGDAWKDFLTSPIAAGGPTGRDHLQDKLSMESGFHLFLVAALVLGATLWTWRELERGRRFRALLIWWSVTSFGAASYAREKVPWVGIHAALPLVLLAGALAQGAWSRARHHALLRPAAIALLALALLWNAKASINACFVHRGDVRERLAFGHTTDDVLAHVEAIRHCRAIASVRMTQVRSDAGLLLPEWAAHHNDPTRLKDVRVLVRAEAITWPLRWYLRDIEWSEFTTPEAAIEEGWPFLFLEPSETERLGELLDGYHVMRGRARMHWTPQVLDMGRLADARFLAIPEFRREGTQAAARADASLAEWNRLRRALLFRDTWEAPGAAWSSLSWVEYDFCVRRDLPGL